MEETCYFDIMGLTRYKILKLVTSLMHDAVEQRNFYSFTHRHKKVQ